MKTIYLSAPMEGIENDNEALFKEAEEYYEDLCFKVINPYKLARELEKDMWPQKPQYLDYLCNDLHCLCEITHIAFLPGWESSKGCRIESALVSLGNIEFLYYKSSENIGEKKLTPRQREKYGMLAWLSELLRKGNKLDANLNNEMNKTLQCIADITILLKREQELVNSN